jgi:hypothetical protein
MKLIVAQVCHRLLHRCYSPSVNEAAKHPAESAIALRRATLGDMASVARIHRLAFFGAMPHMPVLHTSSQSLQGQSLQGQLLKHDRNRFWPYRIRKSELSAACHLSCFKS